MRIVLFPQMMFAQDNNTGYGGDISNSSVSLAERVLKIEKKQDAFNLYLSFSGAGSVEVGGSIKTCMSHFLILVNHFAIQRRVE